MVHVFIVDDHAIFREGLKRVIDDAKDMEVAGEAADGQDALEKILVGTYDVVILDLGLPGMAGFDVLRAVSETAYHARDYNEHTYRRGICCHGA